jgi:hypothetical protein
MAKFNKINAPTEIDESTGVSTRKITGFAKNIGVKEINFDEARNAIVVTYYDKYGGETKQFWFDKSGNKFKTELNRTKAISYQFDKYIKLCQTINPDVKPVDTQDIKVLYEECQQFIDSKLPSECKGFLKMNFKEPQGQYFNFVVSKEIPCYALEEKQLFFREEEQLIFTPIEIKPDQEEEVKTDTLEDKPPF